MRNARPGQDEFRKWETEFHAVAGRRQTFRPLHGSQYRQQAGGGAGQAIRQCSHHSIQDRRFRPHHRAGQRGRSRGSLALPALRLSARWHCLHRGALDRAFAGRRFDSRRACAPASPELLAVIIVMLVYYKRSGINAVLALLLNTVILLAALSYFACGADAARNCGRDFDHRYGGGFQCPDFRAHPRRVAQPASRWWRP